MGLMNACVPKDEAGESGELADHFADESFNKVTTRGAALTDAKTAHGLQQQKIAGEIRRRCHRIRGSTTPRAICIS